MYRGGHAYNEVMMNHLLKTILLAAAALSPIVANADVAISVGIAPPPIPVYVQPPIPGDGYIWVPGYWAWSTPDNDYYWVPGAWMFAPFAGALWTPGYWGWVGHSYIWHGGYWGTHIGYYGGINYGFGYTGIGYRGGYWDHGSLRYNRAINNFGGTHITNVYNAPVHIDNSTHVSYNGGAGGVRTMPTAAQRNDTFQHYAPTSAQVNQEQMARSQPHMRAPANSGAPVVGAATFAKQIAAQSNAHSSPAPRTASSQPSGATHTPGQQYAQRSQYTSQHTASSQHTYSPSMQRGTSYRSSYRSSSHSSSHHSHR
jgi:hypothetical protein